jgi:hypothetical protein
MRSSSSRASQIDYFLTPLRFLDRSSLVQPFSAAWIGITCQSNAERNAMPITPEITFEGSDSFASHMAILAIADFPDWLGYQLTMRAKPVGRMKIWTVVLRHSMQPLFADLSKFDHATSHKWSMLWSG